MIQAKNININFITNKVVKNRQKKIFDMSIDLNKNRVSTRIL